MTVTSELISTVYPVAGGVGAALATRAVLGAARWYVVPDSGTPSDRERGGTALVWTALSWAVSAGVGFWAGKQLAASAPVSSGAQLQPAQSKQ